MAKQWMRLAVVVSGEPMIFASNDVGMIMPDRSLTHSAEHNQEQQHRQHPVRTVEQPAPAGPAGQLEQPVEVG